MQQSESFFQLASALSRVEPNEQEQQSCRQLFAAILPHEAAQTAFFDYCNTWKLAPWICVQLKRQQLWSSLNTATQKAFEQQYQLVRRQNEMRNTTALQLLERFRTEQIEVVVLKGNCLAHEVYQEVGYKRMNDFDILIHKKDWDRIQTIYLESGYIPLGFGWSGEKEKPAKFSHVGMSFISPDFSCIIGSQWGLKSPTTVYKDFIEDAWKSAETFDFLGTQVLQLSPEYHLLHLILHMGVYKCGIRDCMDVYNLLRTKQMNPASLLPLLERCHAVEKATFTLQLASLSAPGVANYILEKLVPKKRHFISKRLNKRLQLHALTGDYQTAYNDYFQDVEKEVIYFNVFPQFHRKLYFYLRIIGLIFLPDRKFILKLNDLPIHTPAPTVAFRRLTTPGRIFSLIAQEIGWKFTTLLFVKLGVDVVVSLKNYIVRPLSYFDYLKSKNIDPKTIEQVVKNIQ